MQSKLYQIQLLDLNQDGKVFEQIIYSWRNLGSFRAKFMNLSPMSSFSSVRVLTCVLLLEIFSILVRSLSPVLFVVLSSLLTECELVYRAKRAY